MDQSERRQGMYSCGTCSLPLERQVMAYAGGSSCELGTGKLYTYCPKSYFDAIGMLSFISANRVIDKVKMQALPGILSVWISFHGTRQI